MIFPKGQWVKPSVSILASEEGLESKLFTQGRVNAICVWIYLFVAQNRRFLGSLVGIVVGMKKRLSGCIR